LSLTKYEFIHAASDCSDHTADHAGGGVSLSTVTGMCGACLPPAPHLLQLA